MVEWLNTESNCENPIKRLRLELNMKAIDFADFIGFTNASMLYWLEIGKYKNIEQAVRKIGLVFDINEGKMIQEYKKLYNID